MRKRLALLAGAIAGAGLLLSAAAPLAPAQAQVDCGTGWEQGTLDDAGSWTTPPDPDTHYRVSCTSDDDNDAVNPATNLPQPWPAGATRLIVHFADKNADSFENTALQTDSEHWVLTGDLGGAKSGVDIDVTSFTSESDTLVVESFAAIAASGASGRGIDLENDDTAHKGRIEAVNRHTITTSGDNQAYGISVLNRSAQKEAETRAVNTGTVTTTGTGAVGIRARVMKDGAGTATVINGRIVTTEGGGFAHGLQADSYGGGDARVTNEANARVETKGDGATGMVVITDNERDVVAASGAATAENSGSVTTRGNPSVSGGDWYPAAGIWPYSERGTATARNNAEGTVETHGLAAYGLFANTFSGNAVAENFGTVIAHADKAADSLPGENAPVGSRGISAAVDSTTSNSGTATARNIGGTITVKSPRARAIEAIHYGSGAVTVTAEGGTTADSGTVTASHDDLMDDANDGVGIYASSGATGSITVDILNKAIIDAPQAMLLEDAPATVTVSGKSRVTGRVDFPNSYADSLADSMTVDDSTVSGNVRFDGGNDSLTVRNNGLVEGDIWFGLGADRLIVDGGTVRGKVDFSGGIHTITVKNDGRIDGRIRFNEGANTLTVENGGRFDGDIQFGGDQLDSLDVTGGARFEGAITGLDGFTGSGGWIRLGDVSLYTHIPKDNLAEFKDNAQVSISGTFDLGERGTMTIHEGARVQLVAAIGEEKPLKIIGGRIDCRDSGNQPTDCTLYVQNEGGAGAGVQQLNEGGAGATAAELVENVLSDETTLSGEVIRYAAQREGKRDVFIATVSVENGKQKENPEFHVDADNFRPGPPINPNTASSEAPVYPSDDPSDENTPDGPPASGDTDDTGENTPDDPPASEDPPAASPTAPGGSSGGGSERGALAGLGLLGLVFALIDSGPDEALAPALSKPAFVQAAGGSGSRWWTRNLAEALPAGGPGSAEGVEIGMEAEVGNGFTLGFAAAPDMAAQQAAGAEAAAFSGSRYSLRGGWRGDRLFAGLRLSHADWRVEGGWDNAAVGERMRSRFDAAHRDVRFSLGARLGLGGGMVLIPQADAFVGEIERGSHTAEGAEFRAAMPGMTQRYSGVRAGLGFASGWQEAGHGLKLRPKLNLSAMRVQADSKGFELEQSNRAGLISTSSRARLAGGPATVFGLGAGLEAAGPGGLQLGFGYAGLVVDGKLTHAAAARLRLPF